MVGFLHEEVPFILPIPEYFVVAQMFHFLLFTYRKLSNDLDMSNRDNNIVRDDLKEINSKE